MVIKMMTISNYNNLWTCSNVIHILQLVIRVINIILHTFAKCVQNQAPFFRNLSEIDLHMWSCD